MSEIPRWDMPAVNFVETDAERVQAEIFEAYRAFTGRTLADGDPVRLFLLSIAAIIVQQRAAINYAGQQNLLTYAQGNFLDALGLFVGVTRLPEAAATATFRFVLSTSLGSAYEIPAGTQITNGEATFATDEAAVIPAGESIVDARATCLTAGAAGNGYAVGAIDTQVSPSTFIESAINITATSGGSDRETDEALAERIRLAPNGFSTAGPRNAYISHTKAVSPAIIDVSVLSPNPGEVVVYTLLRDGLENTPDIIDQISAHLNADDIRPLTDQVTVSYPMRHNYSITVGYYINESDRANAATIRARVEAAVEEYRVWQGGKIGRDLDPEMLACKVKDAGAGRIETLTPAFDDYMPLGPDTVAYCEDVNVMFLGFKAD